MRSKGTLNTSTKANWFSNFAYDCHSTFCLRSPTQFSFECLNWMPRAAQNKFQKRQTYFPSSQIDVLPKITLFIFFWISMNFSSDPYRLAVHNWNRDRATCIWSASRSVPLFLGFLGCIFNPCAQKKEKWLPRAAQNMYWTFRYHVNLFSKHHHIL